MLIKRILKILTILNYYVLTGDHSDSSIKEILYEIILNNYFI